MQPTQDPAIFIEEKRVGYVRYRDINGRRWEVHGVCDGRGNCWIGTVRPDGTMIATQEEARQWVADFHAKGGGLDSPVGPGFKDCCPLTIVEL